MSSESICMRAVDSFIRYCSDTPPSMMFPDYSHDCLADYIRSWVKSGHGVRACLGHYQTFLTAIPALIHEWHRAPMLLDYAPEDADGVGDDSKIIERRVELIFPILASVDHQILDPDFFASCTFNELHGKNDRQ